MGFYARIRRTRRVNQFKRFLIVSAAALISTASVVQETEANSDTRSLTFFHTHTKETATITFRRNGAYDDEALKQLNWLLRDWRVSEPAKMDPRLISYGKSTARSVHEGPST